MRGDYLRRNLLSFAVVAIIASSFHSKVSAAPPAPPQSLSAVDRPNDVGNAVDLSWELSPDDVTPEAEQPRRVIRYEIFRKPANDEQAKFELVGDETYEKTAFSDKEATANTGYLYQIVAVGPDGERSEPVRISEPVTPRLDFFDWSRAWYLLILLLICGSVIFFIQMARAGKPLWIRKIAGLEAVDEAVGRATEMGRDCLFVPGIMDINDIQTVAGITVLSRVAYLVAEYDATLEVPTSRSLVMTTARETVEPSFLRAGRPDAYRADEIYYLTDEQFGYVAGVMGMMVRKKPAACFYMGAFFAESLLLAETGNAIGSIQVAGTAMPSQLPFFVAACDYTLIGEEFFAASAYLSHEPLQLGSLKGQDMGKLLGGSLIVVGCLLATALELSLAFTGEPPTWLAAAHVYLKDYILGDGGLWMW